MAGIKARFGTLLQSIGLPDAELSILFIGDRAMRSLNRRYRGVDRTTDVLSFPFREGNIANKLTDMLGDIVISVPAAHRQARAAGYELSHEIDRLLVHGLAHLLGYDHANDTQEARRMLRKEQHLLNKLS